MIDHHALHQQVQQIRDQLFANRAQEYQQFIALFKRMCADRWLETVHGRTAPWLVARWQGALDAIVQLPAAGEPYQVTAVDGSQVYPDRHEGTLCALINVGGITLRYGPDASAQVYSIPYVYPNTDGALTPELIDCLRQEHELCMTCQQASIGASVPRVVLIDGSLIAWQLHDKPEAIRSRYLSSYLACMQQLYEQRIAYAGYVSVPHNKDLTNLVRWYAHECVPEQEELCSSFIDSDVFSELLPVYARSIVFESAAELCTQYPEHLRPLFFYINVGDEVARVELPRWVCESATMQQRVERVVLDQCLKGQGYPIALAEAHAQAVVKAHDRTLFYRLIAQSTHEQNGAGQVSRKLFSKRRLCA